VQLHVEDPLQVTAGCPGSPHWTEQLLRLVLQFTDALVQLPAAQFTEQVPTPAGQWMAVAEPSQAPGPAHWIEHG
jgi:hypothetical protein